MRRRTLIGALAASVLWAAPGLGAEGVDARSISERAVRAMSARRYTEVLRLACFNGWRFDEASIANGYRRHYEETRLALIDEGYVVTPEPAAPRLIIAGIMTGRSRPFDGASDPACFRARWSNE